jgi:aryl-alcohol dehydrogenase-like predicted oxidoreductase
MIGERYDLEASANAAKHAAVTALREVAADAGMPLGALALAFTQAHPAVSSTIVGARTPEQLEEVLLYAGTRLDPDILDRIDAIVPPGHVLNDADRGWDRPWMAAATRRRWLSSEGPPPRT